MIGKLTGKVDALGEDRVLIDVGGVGYIAFCSGRTLGRLPAVGQLGSLLIETHVREDHIHLYGFIDQAEQDWFRMLSTVQGVGARMALSLLTTLSPEELVHAIAAQDRTLLTRASGVGPKLAGRIVAELKDKIGSIAFLPTAKGAQGTAAQAGPAIAQSVPEDAISALVNLGYRRSEAFEAVAAAVGQLGPEAGVSSLIKVGLKELAS